MRVVLVTASQAVSAITSRLAVITSIRRFEANIVNDAFRGCGNDVSVVMR
jgi:hypothetical protein